MPRICAECGQTIPKSGCASDALKPPANCPNKKPTVPNIERLKREARRVQKQQPELTHTQCIELLSRQAGFNSYAALRTAHKEQNP